MDQWYPGSKFILTLRGSTADVVNSDARMRLMKVIGNKTFEEVYQGQRRGTVPLSSYGFSIADFVILVSKRYELHNERVRSYFQGRESELLEIDLEAEAADPWRKLTDFLGCPIPSKPFPHSNSAKKGIRTEVIPANFVEALNWKQFDMITKDGKSILTPKDGVGEILIGGEPYVCTHCEGFKL